MIFKRKKGARPLPAVHVCTPVHLVKEKSDGEQIGGREGEDDTHNGIDQVDNDDELSNIKDEDAHDVDVKGDDELILKGEDYEHFVKRRFHGDLSK